MRSNRDEKIGTHMLDKLDLMLKQGLELSRTGELLLGGLLPSLWPLQCSGSVWPFVAIASLPGYGPSNDRRGSGRRRAGKQTLKDTK